MNLICRDHYDDVFAVVNAVGIDQFGENGDDVRTDGVSSRDANDGGNTGGRFQGYIIGICKFRTGAKQSGPWGGDHRNRGGIIIGICGPGIMTPMPGATMPGKGAASSPIREKREKRKTKTF